MARRRLVLLLLAMLDVVQGQYLRPAIRARLGRGVFDQISSIAAGIVELETRRVQFPNTQQCFAEGCVQIYGFRVQSFRQPQEVIFYPSPPNRLNLRISNFDFIVVGNLGGQINVIITLPVSGNIFVRGEGLTVDVQMDMQKSATGPYLRFLSCDLTTGNVVASVDNMGLLTNTVNDRFSGQMSAQARSILRDTLCSTMNQMASEQLSSRLSRVPKRVSATELLGLLTNTRGIEIPVRGVTQTLSPEDFQHFFNINRLATLIIDLDMLDSRASSTDYTIGMSGTVRSTRSTESPPFYPPFPFHVPANNQRRMVEVAISEFTVNSLLHHAHRENSLLFHVDSSTPILGPLLKTSCTADEVCLADEVEELREALPGKTLEIILRTTAAPTVRFGQDSATITFEGRALFFVEKERRRVGTIPFRASLLLRANTVGRVLKGSLTVTQLDFLDDVDFFGLSADDLSGVKKATSSALANLANAALARGIPLDISQTRIPLRLSAVDVSLHPGALLLQANVDVYSSLYMLSYSSL